VVSAGKNKEELKKEIGDVYEVIDALIEHFNLDKQEILDLQKKRREKRGGFKDKVFLQEVEE
jgi:predicted house-cleaning noncanonical NTP pyrophosphatase (MazG superfamily)